MSPEEKKDLQRMKTLKVREDLPEDLKLAIETFIEQAYIVGEYDLPHMPQEFYSIQKVSYLAFSCLTLYS